MEPIQESNKTNVNGIETLVEEGPINSLPPELVRVIFSQMESLDPAQLLTVSKLWKAEVINTVKDREYSTTKSFIASLIQNLKFLATDLQVDDMELTSDERSELDMEIKVIDEVCKKLESITLVDKNNDNINVPFNLSTIKTSLVNVEEKIIDILKDLDREILFTLDDMCKNNKTPLTWDMEVYPLSLTVPDESTNLFFLVSVFKILDSMKVHDDDLILQMAMSLSSRGFADRAVKLCKTFSNELNQKEVIEIISINMCEGNQYDKGIKIAKASGIEEQVIIRLKKRNDLNLSNRATELFSMGKFDEAITIVNMLDDNLKNDTLNFATLQLLGKNNMEGAIKTHDLISDESLKASLKRFMDFKQKK